jgi:hypothetical protein
MATAQELSKVVYWHRELPPLEAEPVSERTIEADSVRVPGTIDHRDEIWGRCRSDLMVRAAYRLEQEIARLNGRYAHVFGERIEPKHDYTTGEAWLHGRFTFTIYR